MKRVVGATFCPPGTKYENIPKQYRAAYGQLIPIRVVISNESDGALVIDRTYESLCTMSIGGSNEMERLIDDIALNRGKYSIHVFNIRPFPELKDVITEVGLTGGRGK